jgi:hypothetical protein
VKSDPAAAAWAALAEEAGCFPADVAKATLAEYAGGGGRVKGESYTNLLMYLRRDPSLTPRAPSGQSSRQQKQRMQRW